MLSNLGFPARSETSPWTFGGDEGRGDGQGRLSVPSVVETVGVRAVAGQDRPQTASLWHEGFSLQTRLSARWYPRKAGG